MEDGEENKEEEEKSARVMRTKANCLMVCKKGPIAVVYPEGDCCVGSILFSVFTTGSRA